MTRASSLPARPESTVYPIAVISPLAIHLGGLRRSLVRYFLRSHAIELLLKACLLAGLFNAIYWKFIERMDLRPPSAAA